MTIFSTLKKIFSKKKNLMRAHTLTEPNRNYIQF